MTQCLLIVVATYLLIVFNPPVLNFFCCTGCSSYVSFVGAVFTDARQCSKVAECSVNICLFKKFSVVSL